MLSVFSLFGGGGSVSTWQFMKQVSFSGLAINIWETEIKL